MTYKARRFWHTTCASQKQKPTRRTQIIGVHKKKLTRIGKDHVTKDLVVADILGSPLCSSTTSHVITTRVSLYSLFVRDCRTRRQIRWHHLQDEWRWTRRRHCSPVLWVRDVPTFVVEKRGGCAWGMRKRPGDACKLDSVGPNEDLIISKKKDDKGWFFLAVEKKNGVIRSPRPFGLGSRHWLRSTTSSVEILIFKISN